MRTPDQILGKLFEDVQLSGIFPDSKTFVDCIPGFPAEQILSRYHEQKNKVSFDLASFVDDHFVPPRSSRSTFKTSTDDPVEHIEQLWLELKRSGDEAIEGSSLIPLPQPYIVPGGRFDEIYYWDSYFTMLGLLESGHADLVRSMIDNFAHLIQTIGHIPNGNRTYFKSRSQPPFFALMVDLLATWQNEDSLYVHYLDNIMIEYTFWMTPGDRCISVGDEVFLNRYWDSNPVPRQESYLEDVELSDHADRNSEKLFRDIRAACESGWDFSSRWFVDERDLSTIICSEMLPIDLNCLLLQYERIIHKSLLLAGRQPESHNFEDKARHREHLIRTKFWSQHHRSFMDLHAAGMNPSGRYSLAGLFPLFVGVATPEQADSMVPLLKDKLLKPGGWMTTDVHSKQQWDAPNGWAPLQWIAFRALLNYGFEALAFEGAQRWVDHCTRVFRNTGKMLEKYNVEDISMIAGGGEYPVQDGFGWTNGVLLKLINTLAGRA